MTIKLGLIIMAYKCSSFRLFLTAHQVSNCPRCRFSPSAFRKQLMGHSIQSSMSGSTTVCGLFSIKHFYLPKLFDSDYSFPLSLQSGIPKNWFSNQLTTHSSIAKWPLTYVISLWYINLSGYLVFSCTKYRFSPSAVNHSSMYGSTTVIGSSSIKYS